MVKVEIHGKEVYIDGYLKNALDQIKEAVKKKWDGLFYVGGYEGDGKSLFAEQCAAYYDKGYNIDRCVFTPQQFMEAVDEAEPFEAIVYDEAQDAMESTNKDKTARMIKSKLTRIRKKQLFIFIVAPDFWRINKYLFIHRSRAFIRIYSNELERGYFEYYNRERKHQLKIRGQKNEQLIVPPNFRGRFTNWRVLNEEEYEAKKDAATREVQEDTSKEEKKYNEVLERIINSENLTRAEQAELLGMSARNVRRIVEKTKEKEDADGRTNTKELTKGVAF